MDILIIAIVAGVVFGGFCSAIAGAKNRGTGDWFVLGFLFSLIALIAIAAMPALPEKLKEQTVRRKTAPLGVPEYVVLTVIIVGALAGLGYWQSQP